MSTISSSAPKGAPVHYKAHAVSADGSRKRIHATHIVVNLGDREIQIDLVVLFPLLNGQLSVRALGDGLLVAGHADASSICLSVEDPDGARVRPR